MTRDELRQIIVSEGLGRVAAQIVEAGKPCLRLETRSFNGAELADVSKIGGNPGLPKEIDWPFWNDQPLAFLAQISLSDLQDFDFQFLPKTGFLWFFYDREQTTWGYDPDDIGSFRVTYSEAKRDDLESRTFPEPDLMIAGKQLYAPRQLRFHPHLSIPPWQSLFLDSLDLSSSEKDL